MNFRERLTEKIHLYDGSKGFLLMRRGLAPDECPDAWNLLHPDIVYDIHKEYVDAGSDVIQTNTMLGSRFHLEARGLYEKLGELNLAGVSLAKRAAGKRVSVAASVTSLGRLLAPFGELGFDAAIEAFKEQIAALLGAGADILHFETFSDLSELRAAVIAAKELDSSVPVIATVSIEGDGRTVMGDDAGCVCAALDSLGADCAGANCGLGPRQMLSRFDLFAPFRGPLCSKPNAGKPDSAGGAAVYGATDAEYYETCFGFAGLGARLVGGCCGSNPGQIRRMREAVDAMNADKAYSYDATAGRAPEWNADTVRVSSQTLSAEFTRGDIARYAYGAIKTALSRLVPDGEPAYGETPDGKLLFADLSGVRGTDRTVDILSEASESGAEATVFCFFNRRPAFGKPWVLRAPGGPGKLLAGSAGRAGDGAAAVLSDIAENARAYHKKPLMFFTDDPDGLKGAVRRYCGVTAAIMSAYMTPEETEGRLIAAAGDYGADAVFI